MKCLPSVKLCVISEVNDALALVSVSLCVKVSTGTKQPSGNTVGGILQAVGRATAVC